MKIYIRLGPQPVFSAWKSKADGRWWIDSDFHSEPYKTGDEIELPMDVRYSFDGDVRKVGKVKSIAPLQQGSGVWVWEIDVE